MVRTYRTSVEIVRVQERQGDPLQLLGLTVVELLDISMLRTDHVQQTLDLSLETGHMFLTRQRRLERVRTDMDKSLEREISFKTQLKLCFRL